MDCLVLIAAVVILITVLAYFIGYSVMGWIVRPLEDAAESSDEILVEIRIEDEILTDDDEESERPAD